MTPEELDRILARDTAGVRASPHFAATVMASVRREAEAPPPIPFPWLRAAPGVAAVIVVLALATVAVLTTPGAETTAVPETVARAAAVTTRLGGALADWSARWALISAVVALLTVVPILAPLLFVGAERKSSTFGSA